MRRTSPSLFPLLLLIAATDLAEARAKEEALKSLTKHKCNAMNGELRESKAHLEATIRGQRQKLIGANNNTSRESTASPRRVCTTCPRCSPRRPWRSPPATSTTPWQSPNSEIVPSTPCKLPWEDVRGRTTPLDTLTARTTSGRTRRTKLISHSKVCLLTSCTPSPTQYTPDFNWKP